MSRYEYVLGVDPGLEGALGIIQLDPWNAEAHSFPVLRTSRNRRELNLPLLWEGFRVTAQSGSTLCVIEDVSAMPNQGSASGFRFGEGKGMLRMAATAAGMEVRLVRPSIWKKALGLSSDKAASEGLAVERFPSLAKYFSHTGKGNGRAEALLLALYGYEKLLSKPN